METCFLALSFHNKVFLTLGWCSLTLVDFILTLGIQTLVKTLKGPLDVYMPNMKALALMVWDKKIFKNFLLYPCVKSKNPQHRINFYSRAIVLSILVEGH